MLVIIAPHPQQQALPDDVLEPLGESFTSNLTHADADIWEELNSKWILALDAHWGSR